MDHTADRSQMECCSTHLVCCLNVRPRIENRLEIFYASRGREADGHSAHSIFDINARALLEHQSHNLEA